MMCFQCWEEIKETHTCKICNEEFCSKICLKRHSKEEEFETRLEMETE